MPDQPNQTKPTYFIGPSGWSYPDWSGVVYPDRAGARFDALAYIAKYFNAVEVNTSFYRPVSPRMTSSWVQRVADRQSFRFTFKLHQSFTHERTGYDRTAVTTFLEGLQPVIEAARLGCVLMQFPWSFRRSPASVDWLTKLAEDFGELALVAELRHDSWDVPETFEELRRMHVSWCNIDQPRLRNCVEPGANVTSEPGYVRFHGRRGDTWFTQNIEPFERYNYLYSMDELREWLGRLRRIGSEAQEVYVFSNNHYRGQGPANALQLRALVEERRVKVPRPLLLCFPHLEAIREAPSDDAFPETLF